MTRVNRVFLHLAVQELEILVVLVWGIGVVTLRVYSSALFVEEGVAMTVEEFGNLGVGDALVSYLCCEILHYLSCRRKVTLSKYFYILTKLTLLL